MNQRPAGILATSQSPRDVRPQDYDRAAPISERLKYLINYAVLAPSTHNTQPWLFRVNGDSVDILADRSRALPVIDPEDRGLLISCGAASGTLSTALEAVGLIHNLSFLPDPSEPDLVARIAVVGEIALETDWMGTLNAIRSRKTVRNGFQDRLLRPSDMQFIEERTVSGEASVRLIDSVQDEVDVLRAIGDAETERLTDKHYVRENASWTHPLRNRSRDGIPELANRTASIQEIWSPGNLLENKMGSISRVAVVVSPSNRPLNWLRSGFEMSIILIEAGKRGLNAAIIIHPLQIQEIRLRIEAILKTDWTAQVLLRLGFAERAPLTPRRALVDVMLHPGFSR
ncbi:hypothetical protein HQ496_12365 [bacterium]|nr:hypothetical protein [bacterium]